MFMSLANNDSESVRFHCDVMRAIGIVLVALGHTLGLSDLVQLWIYSFHMPLFFFLSGYVLKESRVQETLQVNVKHYAHRLLVPYFAFSLLTYIPWVFATRIYGADAKLNIHPLRPVIGTFYGIGIDGWLQHNAMLWFLPCLFIVHLVYQLVVKITLYNHRVVASVIVAALGLWLSHILPFRLPWGADIALIAMPFYALGNCVASISICFSRLSIILPILLIMALVQYGCINLNGRVDMNFISLGNIFLYYMAAICGIGSLWCFAKLLPEIEIFKRISNASMLIFVTHRMLYSVLTAILLIFVNDMQTFKTSAAGSIVYAGWAVMLGVLTLGYWRKCVPWMLGSR